MTLHDDAGNIEAGCGTSLTLFLGGAGMAGNYNNEMMRVLREAGICNPQYGNYAGMMGIADGQGILDMLADAVSVPFNNQPVDPDAVTMGPVPSLEEMVQMQIEDAMGITDTRDRLNWQHENRQHYSYTMNGVGAPFPVPQNEDRFNIIGYSWGAAVAARLALHYAGLGKEIDFLALVGAPINASLLNAVDTNGQIKKTTIFNLTGQGDPIYAGMSDAELVVGVPQLIWQMFTPGDNGHFYFSGSGSQESLGRKRYLITHLMGNGLE